MNKTISRYIRQNIKYPILIEDVPAPDLGIIIVIPCHNEPDVVSAVKSIYHSDRPACSVEIIVVINGSDEEGWGRTSSKDRNGRCCSSVCPHGEV